MYIRVDFPSGKYYGAQSHDPSSPEWPPNPSRLFSALVAASYRAADGMTEEKRNVLKLLETLPPPSIFAPVANLIGAPVSYVPPGDAVGRKGKKGEEVFEHGVHRWRQPRYFPSAIIMNDPVVYYEWQDPREQSVIEELDKISLAVSHVGTSHSMVIMSAHPGNMPRTCSLVPDKIGNEFLRVPVKGRLNELDLIYEGKGGLRKPASVFETLVGYKRTHSGKASIRSLGFDFLVLRITGTMHGADTADYLGRALRRAAMSIMGDNAPEAVHGHYGGLHVGWIPLPDVGHRFAGGRIVGAAVAVPKEISSEDRQQILAGIAQLRDLRLPDGRMARLIPISPGDKVPRTLNAYTWTQPSKNWATVTPVVLDRPPKRLSLDKIRQSLIQSLVFAGCPEPDDVEVGSFSRFQGAPPAFRVPCKKPVYHATLRFKEAISGPLLVGRLRYFGVGLFRPLLNSDNGGRS